MSNPVVSTPEVDNKQPNYLPNRGNRSPSPLAGILFPPTLSSTTLPFLATGHPFEARPHTVDPEAPRPVVVDQQSKARVSSPDPVGGGANGEPSATPDLTVHSGPGPSRLVTSKSPGYWRELPGQVHLLPESVASSH